MTKTKKYLVRQKDGYAIPADECMFSQMGSGVRFVHIPKYEFHTDNEFKVVFSDKDLDGKLSHPTTMARLRAQAKKKGIDLNAIWEVEQ